MELHPVMEFLEDGSDGYPTSAYFAVSTRYGTPADFAALVDELHQVGIGVILDWSPAQFPRYAGGLEKFDGTALYEVKDPEMAVHPTAVIPCKIRDIRYNRIPQWCRLGSVSIRICFLKEHIPFCLNFITIGVPRLYSRDKQFINT